MLTPQEKRHYCQQRRTGVLARYALRNARILAAWDSLEEDGLVRLRIEYDSDIGLADLEGDMFSPTCHPDIRPSTLERQREQFYRRIKEEGVWGMIGEYLADGTWYHADSVWGFVGDDWAGSGYDVDIMAETIDALGAVAYCVSCHQRVA